MTSVPLEKRAPTLIEQLTGLAQIIAKTPPLTTLTSNTAPEKLIMEMDKKCGFDSPTLLHNNDSTLFDSTWDKTTTVDGFVLVFHSRLGKTDKLELNNKLKGHLPLRQAHLYLHDRNTIIGLWRGDYPLQALSTSLKNGYRQEWLPLSSMNSVRRGANRPKFDCNPQTSTKGSNSNILFYTYFCLQKQNESPFAVVVASRPSITLWMLWALKS